MFALRKFCQYQTFRIVRNRTALFCSEEAERKTETATIAELEAALKTSFPTAKKISVVSPGLACHGMFEITVESNEFQGLPLVKQHMAVTNALKDLTHRMHGLTIQTIVPAKKQ